MSWWTAPTLARELVRNLIRGQTNFIRGIRKYNKIYSIEKMLADHARPVRYELPFPPGPGTNAPAAKAPQLYIHTNRGRKGRSIDELTSALSMRPAQGRPHDYKIILGKPVR